MIRIKSAEEIEILKIGGARHAFILRELAKMVVLGVSTLDLENAARNLLAEQGDIGAFLNYKPHGAPRPYPAVLCVSVNDEIVHGIPNELPRILQEGDVVSLDLGVTHEKLITDAAITVGVGAISEENRKLIEHCKEALYIGIKAARGGVKVQEVGRAIENFAREKGLNLCEGLSGHGVGYAVHEDPFVPNVPDPTQRDVLKPGMVVAIEPMMTFGTSRTIAMPDGYTYKTADGSIAAHFEHTVVITDGEPVIVTKLFL